MLQWADCFDGVLIFRLKFLNNVSGLEASWDVAQHHADPFNVFLHLPIVEAESNLVRHSGFVSNQMVKPFENFVKQFEVLGSVELHEAQMGVGMDESLFGLFKVLQEQDRVGSNCSELIHFSAHSLYREFLRLV